jgi:hypothetical protein
MREPPRRLAFDPSSLMGFEPLRKGCWSSGQ